jgi:hypothetical protein
MGEMTKVLQKLDPIIIDRILIAVASFGRIYRPKMAKWLNGFQYLIFGEGIVHCTIFRHKMGACSKKLVLLGLG